MPLSTPIPPRVFCIGRNYVKHVQELSNAMPEKPVVFFKPASCLAGVGELIHFPKHGQDLHHEAEVVVRIGKQGRVTTPEQALAAIDAITLGVDLTLRDVQADLKAKRLPWEKAKAFEQSAFLGEFVPYESSIDLQNLDFRCTVNGKERQHGNTGDMIFSIPKLLIELSEIWNLLPGDLVYTGTPAGVSALQVGDIVTVTSERIGSFSWTLVE